MRRRPIPTLGIALFCGLAAAYLTLGYVRGEPVQIPVSELNPLQVVVAARDLPIGARLAPEDVRVMAWSGDSIPPGFIGSADEVIGHGLLMPLRANEPLLTSKLAGEGAGSGLPILIPSGMRAVSVRVDEVIAVAGFVLPGTRVDVVATLGGSEGTGASTSRVILQNVQVVATGQSMQVDSDGKPQSASVITVLVTPQEAEALTLAAAEGRIQLALRNGLDGDLAQTTGVGVRTLASGRNQTAPQASPVRRAPGAVQSRANSIEVFHGSTRSVTVF